MIFILILLLVVIFNEDLIWLLNVEYFIVLFIIVIFVLCFWCV